MATTVQTSEAKKARETSGAPAKRASRSPKRKTTQAQKRSRSGSSRGGRKSSTAQSTSAQLYRQGRDAVTGAYDKAVKVGRAVPQLAGSTRSRGQSVYSMMEDRPLMLGAVGLGVGMVIAALLPSMTGRSGNRSGSRNSGGRSGSRRSR